MKYRLIKWYPSLPDKLKEGDIVTLEVNKYYYFFETIERWEVENYPEFWEKVEEKSYEILSYTYPAIKALATKRSNGLFINDEDPSKLGIYPEPLESHWRINSIKRLSDKEIFTLGDIIDGISHRNVKINSIESNPNCNQIMFNRLDEGIDLLNARKSQQPLFTADDGVDIYKGDTYCFVTVGGSEPWKVKKHIANWDSKATIPLGQVQFSNAEKAEEWVLWNKPCISLNDVHQTTLSSCYADILDNLKEIVKSRL